VTNVALLHFGAEKVRTFLKTTAPFLDIFDAKNWQQKTTNRKKYFLFTLCLGNAKTSMLKQ